MGRGSRRIRRAGPRPNATEILARQMGVPEAQIARGCLAQHDVANRSDADQRHSIRSEETRTVRHLYPHIVDRWLAEGGPGFELPERQAIDHCRGLWLRAATEGRLVANLNGTGGGSGGDGWSQHEALAELGVFQDRLPRHVWDVFVNVVRHDLPAGTAGSNLANNTAQQQAAAKACVGFAASMIAQWRRF